MTARISRAAALLALLPLAGCGTVANLTPPNPDAARVPFGGVKHDLAGLRGAAHGAPGCEACAGKGGPQYPHTALAALCAADLPFSLVGDLVTWPYIRVYNVVNAPVPTAPLTFADPGAIPARPVPPTPPKQMPLPVPPELPKGAAPPAVPVPLPPLPKPAQLP